MTDETTDNPEFTYLKAAIGFHNARGRSDHRASNKAQELIIRAAKKIVAQEDRGQAFFQSLQSHPLSRVRTWAACHLLPIDESNALATLEDVAAHGEWEASLSAETAIAEWKAGRFDPHWFMREDTKK